MNKLFTFFRESSTARFLIPAGLILTICGVVFFIVNNENKNYIEIESTVTNVEVEQEAYTDTDGNTVEATYKVNVSYTVSDKEYNAELNGMSKYEVGDKIKIFYNPDDPSKVTQTKSLVLPIILIVGGLAAFVGGIISGLNAIKKYKNMKEQEKGWANGK